MASVRYVAEEASPRHSSEYDASGRYSGRGDTFTTLLQGMSPDAALQSFIPQRLRSQLLARGAGGEGRHWTHLEPDCIVSIIDLSGFSALSHELRSDSDLLVEGLNHSFKSIIEAVESSSGDVVSFAGDALICAWAAGLEVEAVSALISVVVGSSGSLLPLHAGIGHGFALEINVGADNTFQFFVTGSALLDAGYALAETESGDIGWGANFEQVMLENFPEAAGFCKPRASPGEIAILSDAEGFLEKAHENKRAQGSRASRTSPVCNSDEYLSSLDDEQRQMLAKMATDYIPRYVMSRLFSGNVPDLAALGNMRTLDDIRVVSTVFLHINLQANFAPVDLPTIEEANALGETAQTFFAHALELLNERDGMVRQFVVDDKGCVLIVCFGVPGYAHDDDPKRAIDFALAVEQRITHLDINMGVTTARLFCGSVGTKMRREYAVVGDGCNLAARLMKETGGTRGIVCDGPTYTATCSEFQYRVRRDVTLKGQPNPMDVYHLEGRDLTAADARNAEYAEAFGAFVGRPAEKAFVMNAIFNAKVVYVTGPEGYGKSALMGYASTVSRKMGLTTLVASASEQLKLKPLGCLGLILKQLLRLDSSAFRGLSSSGKVQYVKRIIQVAVRNFGVDVNEMSEDKQKMSSTHSKIGQKSAGDNREKSIAVSGLSSSARMPSSSGIDGLQVAKSESHSSVRFTESKVKEEFRFSIAREASMSKIDDDEKKDARSIFRSSSSISRASTMGQEALEATVSTATFSSPIGRNRSASISSSEGAKEIKANDIEAASQFGFSTNAKIHPSAADGPDPTAPQADRIGDEDAENCISESKSSIAHKTSFYGPQGAKKLCADDFLFLLQSTIDLGLSVKRTETIDSMPALMRSEALLSFVYFLLSSLRKVVIVIDEIDHLDAHSWRVLLRLAGMAANTSIVLSGVVRSKEAVAFMTKLVKFKRYDRIIMQPLDIKAISTLAASLSEGLKWPENVIKCLHETTSGHPSQCVELIKTLWSSNKVKFGRDGDTRTLEFCDDETIQSTIVHFEMNTDMTILQHFDALSDVAKELLKGCAVWGHHFTLDLLTELLPRSMKSRSGEFGADFDRLILDGWIQADDVNDRISKQYDGSYDLSGGEGRKLRTSSSGSSSPLHSRPSSAGSCTVKSGGSAVGNDTDLWGVMKKRKRGCYSFVDVKVLKVIYEMIPASTTRKQLHLRVAKAIKKEYIDDLGAFFPLLVHHFHLGGDMENEIKNAQMASDMTYRMGHVDDTIAFTQICVDLAGVVKFREYERFDKNATLSEWYLRLAECQYVVGELKMAKFHLSRAFYFAKEQQGKFEIGSTASLKKEIMETAKWIFSRKYKGSPLRKNDETGSTIVKSLVMICLLSIVNLDEPTLTSAVVMLLREFRLANTIHSAAEACMLCYSMRNFAGGGMFAGLAHSYVEKKGKRFMKDQGKMFKLSSAICVDLFQAHYISGKDFYTAKIILEDRAESMKAMQTNVGQLEVQYALWHLNSSLGLEREALANSSMLEMLAQHASSPTFEIWTISSVVRKASSLRKALTADEDTKENLRSILAQINTLKQVCDLNYSSISKNVMGNEDEKSVTHAGSNELSMKNSTRVTEKNKQFKQPRSTHQPRSARRSHVEKLSGKRSVSASKFDSDHDQLDEVCLPALSCLELHANDAFVQVILQEKEWEMSGLLAGKEAMNIVIDSNVADVTPLVAKSYYMVAEVLLYLKEFSSKWTDEDDLLLEKAKIRCAAVGARYASMSRTAKGIASLCDMQNGKISKSQCGSKLRAQRVEAEKLGYMQEVRWCNDYIEICNKG